MNVTFLNPFVEACRPGIDEALAIAEQESNAIFRRRIARDMGALLTELPSHLKWMLND